MEKRLLKEGSAFDAFGEIVGKDSKHIVCVVVIIVPLLTSLRLQ